MGVCQVSLCGRDGDEMWNDAPMCTEHHEDAVEILANAIAKRQAEKRDHENGTCACSIFEPVEACRWYQQSVRNR